MPTYIVLASFTEQGIRNIKDSPKRADAFKDMAKKVRSTVKRRYWTLGQYDFVAIVEAPDDVTMTALGLSTGKLGNVRTQTLRAFSAADMKGILDKTGIADGQTRWTTVGPPASWVVRPLSSVQGFFGPSTGGSDLM